MSDRKPTSVVLPAVVVLALLGLYVGAYYALVDRNALGPDPDGSEVCGVLSRDEQVAVSQIQDATRGSFLDGPPDCRG